MFIDTENLLEPKTKFKLDDKEYTLSGTIENLMTINEYTKKDPNTLINQFFITEDGAYKLGFFDLANIFSGFTNINPKKSRDILYNHYGMVGDNLIDLRFMLYEILVISIARPNEKKRKEILQNFEDWIKKISGAETLNSLNSLGETTEGTV